MNHALVVFAHGDGFVVCWEIGADPESEALGQFIDDAGGGETFDLAQVGVDCPRAGAGEVPPDGVYVVDMALADDGPGDWPGSREAVVQMSNFRLATADEWSKFRKGEYPWFVPEQIERKP